MSSLQVHRPNRRSIGQLNSLIGIVGFLFLTSSAFSQTTTCLQLTGTIETWPVPAGVTSITAEAWGAQGGNSFYDNITHTGGLGAYMKGDFAVSPGDVLKVLVGGQGESLAVGGGGGGSFLATNGNAPLLVAGGGGGASSDQDGVGAVTSQSGTADSVGAVTGGSAGAGGSACGIDENGGGGGGGFLSDGADANSISSGGFGGKAFVNGGGVVPGGRLDGACDADPAGGYGGGGSASCNTVGGGGGGGYSGGGGGQHIDICVAGPRAGGGGGGSFNGGANQTNIAATRAGNGQVCLTYGVTPSPTIVTVAPNQGPPGGGQVVTITGTNLTGASAVSFGGTPATSFTVNGATSITATTPPHGAGAVDVVVTTPGGSVRSMGAYLYVVPFLAIPTLSDWGLVLSSALLAFAAVVAIRRRS